MATKAVMRQDGTVFSVYSDKWRGLLEALGEIEEVKRATVIDWDHDTQEWVGRLCRTGQEIARSRSRDEAIAQEIAWLEHNVVV